MDAFDAAMTEQRERARKSATVMPGVTLRAFGLHSLTVFDETVFDAGDNNELSGVRVVALVQTDRRLKAAGSEVELCLTGTPFYAEMGGQDTGKC